MNLNRTAFASLCVAFLLSACSGGDGFGVGNASDGITDDSGSTSVGAGNTEVRAGNGSGSTFQRDFIDAESTKLDAFGSTPVFVTIVDEDANLYLGSSTVTFTSDCLSRGISEMIPASSEVKDGAVTAVYKANGCTGTDRLFANFSLGNLGDTVTSLSARVDITISALGLGTGFGPAPAFNSGAMNTTVVDSLTYGGDAAVSVNVVSLNDDNAATEDDNELFTQSVSVTFSSECADRGEATIESPIVTSTGTATAKYSAITCVGSDTITATVGSDTEAETTITIADQVLGSIEFQDALPATLALSGSGSEAHPEVSTISFAVKDEVGRAMAGHEVNFTLSTTAGGIELASSTSVTDSEGLTSVQLNSGSVNTSVSVTATVTIDGVTKSTTSDPIAILGGLPDQDSFDIAATVLNPRAWNFIGEQSTITVRAGDRNNNLAREGTQVSFVTNGGSIVGSCEIDQNGSCKATWTGQAPRTGLVTILARTTGEESFVDTNGNGLYDIGETIIEELDEAFADENFNGVYDEGEFYNDFNENGQFDEKDPAGIYQGTNCSDEAAAQGHCANLVEVRDSLVLSMSTDGIEFSASIGGVPLTTVNERFVFIDASSLLSQFVTVTISDENGNSAPNGTSFEVANTNLVSGNSEFVLPNSPYPLSQTVLLSPVAADTFNQGDIEIKATSPSGASYFFTIYMCETGVAGSGTSCNP